VFSLSLVVVVALYFLCGAGLKKISFVKREKELRCAPHSQKRERRVDPYKKVDIMKEE
jgi:hypothetical protein